MIAVWIFDFAAPSGKRPVTRVAIAASFVTTSCIGWGTGAPTTRITSFAALPAFKRSRMSGASVSCCAFVIAPLVESVRSVSSIVAIAA